MDNDKRDTLVDILNTISAIWTIESGEHPKIKVGSKKYKEFITWARETYSGDINGFITELEFDNKIGHVHQNIKDGYYEADKDLPINELLKIQRELNQRFQDDLIEAYGLSDNPKAKEAFNVARYGENIFLVMEQFHEQVKDIKNG